MMSRLAKPCVSLNRETSPLLPDSSPVRVLFRTALILALALWSGPARGAAELSTRIAEWLQRPLLESSEPLEQVQSFTERRILDMPSFESSREFEAYAGALREEILREVVFRGTARDWREAKTRVEWMDTIAGGPGYRIRKLRYEALPGLWIPALLYEPEHLSGKTAAILNVNGHDGLGKAADYKQLRCINQAKRGCLALNVEWLGMGQLRGSNYVHYRMNQLDLCGASGLAPFYLAMARALDLLLAHENTDPDRVAVAGLSGGGWQTIFISSLDTRVKLANPVAGYSSFKTRARYLEDLGDSEQTPNDLAAYADYTHLTALLAPRPALLTFNEKDNCCFASGHALLPLWQAAEPVYALFGRTNALRVHVNADPGDHNFGLDNREAFYRMLEEHFLGAKPGLQGLEIASENELKTAEELDVPLPEQNHHFNSLARQLARDLPRDVAWPTTREAALE